MQLFARATAIAAVAAALAAGPASAEGTLRIGWNQEPRTINPMSSDTVQAVIIMRSMLYDTLVAFDEKLNIRPMLAKSWESSEDGTKWTFTLNDGATWHDGEPLTSEDVAFTLRYIRDNEIKTLFNYVKDIEKVETPDGTTVALTYGEPSASVLADLANVFIVAKHKWEKIPGEEASTYENAEPLGSGPFRFKEWKKNAFISFEANKDYWRNPPEIDSLIYTYFASRDPMILSLKNGEIHAIGSELPPLAAATLARDERVKVAQATNLYYRHIVLNAYDEGQGHPALRDAKVRQALAMAVDKAHLAKVIHRDFVEQGLSVIMKATPDYYNDELEPYPFDLEKAAGLLEEAGWSDSDGDGVRDKDGKALNLELLVISRWAEEMRAAEMIRDGWNEIGVGLALRAADGGTILSEIFPDYKHDMYLWGFSGQPDPNFSLSIYTSGQVGKWNGAGYENPEYDALYEKQGKTMDPEARRKLVYEMQEVHYADSPSIVLYYTSAISAYRQDLVEGLHESMPGGIVSNLNVDNFTDVSLE